MGSLQQIKHALHKVPRYNELCGIPIQRLSHGNEFHLDILLLREELTERQSKNSGKIGAPKSLKRN
jgi:hypothetical protein